MSISFFKSTIYFALLLITLTFFCCGSPDNYQELSGNYFFRGGDGDGILSHIPGQGNIYGKVISYNFDDEFILARQLPEYADHKSMLSSMLLGDLKRYPQHSSQDIARSQVAADSILKYNYMYKKIFSAKENYWIISHQNRKVYGPLNREEYKIKMTSLQVPDQLQLE